MFLFLFFFFFFFSSRRRHTRFSRDWSSDVCSSDLLRAQGAPPASRCRTGDRLGGGLPSVHLPDHASFVEHHPRSEEHTSELQSRENLVCRLLLEKKKNKDPPKQSREIFELRSCYLH